MPAFAPLDNMKDDISKKMQSLSKIAHSQLQLFVEDQQENNHLGYNHFVSVQDVRKVCPTTNDDFRMQKVDVVASNLVNGYDGFSGVHNNLLWSL